jgi:putative ABC transport system substrate-binding protein
VIKRREFITLLSSAAAWPLGARAQQPTMPVIGFLDPASPNTRTAFVSAFRKGLGEAGYVEGQNVAVEYRWAEGKNNRLPALAADLVARQVTVIAASGGIPSAQAAKAATTTIPIVFLTATDPVQFGLVASLNRPGGNLTGVTTLGVEVGPKRLELVHELVPTATIVAFLVNPTSPLSGNLARELMSAARTLGVQLHVLHASTERELDAVFETLIRLRAGALVIGIDAFFISRSNYIAALSLRHGVPTIFQNREFAVAGGLMSYGGSGTDAYRQVGVYTGRILKGEKPADLPVQQSTKVELIINLKTAKALGLDVPTSILLRADEVIE